MCTMNLQTCRFKSPVNLSEHWRSVHSYEGVELREGEEYGNVIFNHNSTSSFLYPLSMILTSEPTSAVCSSLMDEGLTASVLAALKTLNTPNFFTVPSHANIATQQSTHYSQAILTLPPSLFSTAIPQPHTTPLHTQQPSQTANKFFPPLLSVTSRRTLALLTDDLEELFATDPSIKPPGPLQPEPSAEFAAPDELTLPQVEKSTKKESSPRVRPEDSTMKEEATPPVEEDSHGIITGRVVTDLAVTDQVVTDQVEVEKSEGGAAVQSSPARVDSVSEARTSKSSGENCVCASRTKRPKSIRKKNTKQASSGNDNQSVGESALVKDETKRQTTTAKVKKVEITAEQEGAGKEREMKEEGPKLRQTKCKAKADGSKPQKKRSRPMAASER